MNIKLMPDVLIIASPSGPSCLSLLCCKAECSKIDFSRVCWSTAGRKLLFPHSLLLTLTVARATVLFSLS
jgi:hypothetical protein